MGAQKGGLTHSDLVKRAEKWLRAFGCKVVLAEFHAVTNNGEIPDAIAWKFGASVLIECKASRSDFLSDKQKCFRKAPELGMGRYRFYMCPPHVIEKEDLPDGWGLLWVRGKHIERIVAPRGNQLMPTEEFKRFTDYGEGSEICLLVSALRRLELRGYLPEIYENVSRGICS